MEGKLFREKAVEKISSPDQLTDYLRVTNPGIWAILLSVLLIMGGILAWSAVGTLETAAPATVLVESEEAKAALLSSESDVIKTGMVLRIGHTQSIISKITKDKYGRDIAHAKMELPDGTYEGVVVTEKIHPISFLLKGR